MSRQKLGSVLALSVLVALVAVIGCAPQSHEERVAEMRSRYEATVNEGGFVATPILPEVSPLEGEEGEEGMEAGEEAAEPATDEPATDETGADEGMPSDEMMGDEMMGDELGLEPSGYDITLDIILSNGNRENLPQLTVDVVQVDSSRNEKKRWQHTFDTSGVFKGGGTQVSYTLENVDYEEGDSFYTEVRHPVPPEEYGKYPEFSGS